MSALPAGAAHLSDDGTALYTGRGPGRGFKIDARCLQGVPVAAAYALVCALPDPEAALTFDQPEIQPVRRDALAWWIGQLGDALMCLTTLALDETRYGSAITVTRAPVSFHDDPFARILPGPSSGATCSARWRRPPGRSWSDMPGALAGRDIRRTLITPMAGIVRP